MKIYYYLLLSASLSLLGCSENLKKQNTSLSSENQSLRTENKVAKNEIETLRKAIEASEKNRMQEQAAYKMEIKLLNEEISKIRDEANLARGELEAIKKSAEQSANRPGKLRATVTYKYNDFVGHRGDSDTSIALYSDVNHFPYKGTVGGDGKAVINQIKPGKYLCILQSGNTRPGIDKEDIEKLKEKLGTNMAEAFAAGALVAKTKVLEVEIFAGEETEINFDFGVTGF